MDFVVLSKVLSEPHDPYRVALISVSLALSQTPVYTARLRHGYGANASRGVTVYVPAFVGSLVLIAPTHGGMAMLS